ARCRRLMFAPLQDPTRATITDQTPASPGANSSALSFPVGSPRRHAARDRGRARAYDRGQARERSRPLRHLLVERLVPRTRSSRISCDEFDRELRVQRGTRTIELLVVLDPEVRKRGCLTMMRTSESDHEWLY